MKSSIYAALAVAIAIPAPFGAAAQGNALTCGQSYTIASGDTLSAINARAYGTYAFEALHEANIDVIGKNPNRVFVGQKIMLPCFGESGSLLAQQTIGTPIVVAAASEATEDVVSVEPLVFTFNKVSAPKFVANTGILDQYLAQIADVTEGRVTFVDPAEMNRDPSIQYNLVTTGAVDAGYVFNGYLADSHPLLELPMLPMMGGSAEQTAVSLWNLHEDYLSQTDYFDGAHLLGFIAAPAAHIWQLNDYPVTAGMSIMDQNAYVVPYFEGLDTRGPKAIQKETADMVAEFNETANGTMTFFLAHGAARASGIWNNDRTVTEINNGVYTPTFSVILNNDAWDQISPADQAAIMEISGETLAHRSASWDAFDNGHRMHMIDTGLNVAQADAGLLAELEAHTQSRLDAWLDVAGTYGIGQEAIDAYRADLKGMQNLLLFAY